MGQFERLFDGVAFKKGTLVDFSASGKGKLITKIDGKQVRASGADGAICGPAFDRWFDLRLTAVFFAPAERLPAQHKR